MTTKYSGGKLPDKFVLHKNILSTFFEISPENMNDNLNNNNSTWAIS